MQAAIYSPGNIWGKSEELVPRIARNASSLLALFVRRVDDFPKAGTHKINRLTSSPIT
jgi:hypothetical protein